MHEDDRFDAPDEEHSRESTLSSLSNELADMYSIVMCIAGKPRVRALCTVPYRLSPGVTVSRKASWDSGSATFEKLLLFVIGEQGNVRLREHYHMNAKKVDLKLTRYSLLKSIDHDAASGITVERRNRISDAIESVGGDHKVICFELMAPAPTVDDSLSYPHIAPPVDGSIDTNIGGEVGSQETTSSVKKPLKNAFAMLTGTSVAMASVTAYPPKIAKTTLNAKDRLHNSVIDYMVENRLAFREDECMKIGADVASAIVSVLWETDGHELRVFPSFVRGSTSSSLPSALAAIKNFAALQWVVEDGSSRTEATGFNFNTRWKLYNATRPRCETKNLEVANAALDRVVSSHWFNFKAARCHLNDSWDLLLRGLKTAKASICIEIDKLREKALTQAEYVKDIKTGARVVNASPSCTIYAIPLIAKPTSVSTKPWYNESTSLKRLWAIIDSSKPFDIIDPVQVFDSSFSLSLTRHKKYSLYMTHIATGIPTSEFPHTIAEGGSINMISLSYKGSHPNMYYFVKKPELGTLFAADASKVVDETLCTNKMLEIVQFLEEKGVRNSLKALVRFKLSTLLEDTEYSMNGYDADVVMEKAIALWADENPMPTGAADKKNHLAALVEQALQSIDEADSGMAFDTSVVEDLQDLYDNEHAFQPFIDAVKVIIAQDQLHVADSRRHSTMATGMASGSTIGYLPIAISVSDLHRKATSVLEAGSIEDSHKIPSLEWLRLQFQPSNPFSHMARKFTGRFPLMLSTQERTRRKANADAYYVICLHKYMRSFAMLHSENVLMIGMDDKAKIPVGEPGFRKAAIERNRRHIGSTTGEAKERSKAADHDQSSHFSLTPSAYLFHDIPRSESQTIYKGQAVIVLKNAVFEASNAQRHAAELMKTISFYDRQYRRSTRGQATIAMGIKSPMERSVLVLNSDGGPDHNCRFFRAIIWDLLVCQELDLDMLIHYRCYGNGSYINPVERVMAPLSAALSGVCTERIAYPDEKIEKLLSGSNSMNALRAENDRQQHFGESISISEATSLSLSNVINDLEQTFSRTMYDQKFFLVGEKATASDLKQVESALREFYPDYNPKKCRWGDYEKLGGDSLNLYELLRCPEHCNRTMYCFQFKKCGNLSGCRFGFCKPVRMDLETFASMKFVPMPSPDPDRDGKYVPFAKASERADTYCPSVMRNAQPVKEQLKVNFTTGSHPDDLPRLLVNKKARAWVLCTSCSKPRLIYSDSPLTEKSLMLLRDLEETSQFVCGNEFVPADHILHRAWSGGDLGTIRHTSSTSEKVGKMDDHDSSDEDAVNKVGSHPSSSVAVTETVSGGVPYTNSCGLVVRRGLTCLDPIESTFFAMQDPKSTLDPFYRTKAFGKLDEGGIAPNGFCYACGATENLLVLERLEIIQSGTPTVSPLCAPCRERGIDFRVRRSAKTNYGRATATSTSTTTSNKWVPGSLCMARFKKAAPGAKVLYFPAMIKSSGKDGKGPFDVWYFDGDKDSGLPMSSIWPFVDRDSMVYAKFNSNTKSYFPAKVTAVNNLVTITPTTCLDKLPKVTVDLLFTDDDLVRKACPLAQIYKPARVSPVVEETKKDKKAANAKRGMKRKRAVDG